MSCVILKKLKESHFLLYGTYYNDIRASIFNEMV